MRKRFAGQGLNDRSQGSIPGVKLASGRGQRRFNCNNNTGIMPYFPPGGLSVCPGDPGATSVYR
ncbi:MAG TPA: hypothetical protein VG890_04905 [Puia sp.]|nr:hypothetical protein [Puia sp.]